MAVPAPVRPPTAVSSTAPRGGGLPAGTPVVWDERTRLWRDGSFLTGGAPWGLVRLSAAARPFVRRLHDAGPAGLVPATETERATADLLVERGVVHPVVRPRPVGDDVVVVIPAHDRADLLEACLRGLTGLRVVVVDDASTDPEAVGAVARAHGAELVRHEVNQGPGAARNTGLAATQAPIVVFLDSDCTTAPGWLEGLVAHFDDPRVGVVAPRVRPRQVGRSLLARHEDARSALDMGGRRELVRLGSPLGFLPSAALLVRRAALDGHGFEASMRVGEDVDLVWRLVDAGWHARYEPTVTVHHEMRLQPADWAHRRFDYGTSAADLDRRHPGRLAPVRVSGWNLAAGALLLAGRPRSAALVALAAAGALGYRLRDVQAPVWLAGVVVGKGLLADAVAVGHALRREWWPLGWMALATAPRSRTARAGAAAMLAPIALEHVRNRPAVDPVRYTLLRLVEDAAYGSGVLVSALRGRRPRALAPQVRWPSVPRARRRR